MLRQFPYANLAIEFNFENVHPHSSEMGISLVKLSRASSICGQEPIMADKNFQTLPLTSPQFVLARATKHTDFGSHLYTGRFTGTHSWWKKLRLSSRWNCVTGVFHVGSESSSELTSVSLGGRGLGGGLAPQ